MYLSKKNYTKKTGHDLSKELKSKGLTVKWLALQTGMTTAHFHNLILMNRGIKTKLYDRIKNALPEF